MDEIIELYMKGVDVTLLEENLKLTHEERLERLQQLADFAEELKAAGNRLRDNEPVQKNN